MTFIMLLQPLRYLFFFLNEAWDTVSAQGHEAPVGWSLKLLPGCSQSSGAVVPPALCGLLLMTCCSLLTSPSSGAAVGLVALASRRLGAGVGCIRELQFREQQGAAAEPWDVKIPELRAATVGHLAPKLP